jgi:hypothetical protein
MSLFSLVKPAGVTMTAEENFRLLQEMDANRRFMLAAYRDNPTLLANAEPRIRAWLAAVPAPEVGEPENRPRKD